MSNPDYVKYVGLTLGDFPLLALTFTKYPQHFGDVESEYQKKSQFDASSDKSYDAHVQVGVGLLGMKFPSTPKSPSNVKYYGLTIADFPLAAIVVNDEPGIAGDLRADFGSPELHAENAVRGTSAHKNVAVGLLGIIRIPLRK